MSVPLLEAIADAIYRQEGANPNARAYRNRNPGNLRAWSPNQRKDTGGFRIFDTFCGGYQALLDDLRAKVTGHDAHALGMDSSLLDLLSVYAPAADHNAPRDYAQNVADWLSMVYGGKCYITDSFSELFHELAKEAPPSGVVAA